MAYKPKIRWRDCDYCGCRYDSKGGSPRFCMPAHKEQYAFTHGYRPPRVRKQKDGWVSIIPSK